ncbi:MAG: hypothetical protein RMJ38_04260 [candidate division WOR-3 bacterium]|nr:hypothetical protein [candidate division WOR-3 bacterium]MDW8150635.1 hypothetical protein [candidate division WOR-3 bacterium]
MKEFLKEIKENLSQDSIKSKIIEIAKKRNINVSFKTSIHLHSAADLISDGKLEFFKGEKGVILNKLEKGYLLKFDLVVKLNALLVSIILEEEFSYDYLDPYDMIFRITDRNINYLDQISALGSLLNVISLGNIALYRGESVIFEDNLSEVNYNLNSIAIGEEVERTIKDTSGKIIPVIMSNIGVVFRYSSIPIIYVDEELLKFSTESPITGLLNINSEINKFLHKTQNAKTLPVTIEAQFHSIILD